MFVISSKNVKENSNLGAFPCTHIKYNHTIFYYYSFINLQALSTSKCMYVNNLTID